MAGSIPLALGRGQGGELMRPLAIAVVSGLLVSSFLTLFVVPSFYVILHRAGEGVKRFVLGDKPPAGGRGKPRETEWLRA